MRKLASLLGRIAPRFCTLAQWIETYQQIIAARPISPKTLQNARCNIRHLTAELGHMPIRSIRPLHVAVAVRKIWQSGRQFTARRVLIDAGDVFNEALLAGIINTNPARQVKQLPAKIKRQRLTLDQWLGMQQAAQQHRIKWLEPMLLLAIITGQRRADIQKMRFSDVWDDHLHIIQQKTGTRLAIPLALRLNIIDISLADAIELCRHYSAPGATMLRKSNGEQITTASLSARFEEIFERVYGKWNGAGSQPSLHECRSLSERLYRTQGIDTQILLGHKRKSMTDLYNDDRGLTRDDWKRLVL